MGIINYLLDPSVSIIFKCGCISGVFFILMVLIGCIELVACIILMGLHYILKYNIDKYIYFFDITTVIGLIIGAMVIIFAVIFHFC